AKLRAETECITGVHFLAGRVERLPRLPSRESPFSEVKNWEVEIRADGDRAWQFGEDGGQPCTISNRYYYQDGSFEIFRGWLRRALEQIEGNLSIAANHAEGMTDVPDGAARLDDDVPLA
ncbi:MAG TPA: hypothetical protein VGL71_00850, partial [Urbifossiella sp.]